MERAVLFVVLVSACSSQQGVSVELARSRPQADASRLGAALAAVEAFCVVERYGVVAVHPSVIDMGRPADDYLGEFGLSSVGPLVQVSVPKGHACVVESWDHQSRSGLDASLLSCPATADSPPGCAEEFRGLWDCLRCSGSGAGSVLSVQVAEAADGAILVLLTNAHGPEGAKQIGFKMKLVDGQWAILGWRTFAVA